VRAMFGEQCRGGIGAERRDVSSSVRRRRSSGTIFGQGDTGRSQMPLVRECARKLGGSTLGTPPNGLIAFREGHSGGDLIPNNFGIREVRALSWWVAPTFLRLSLPRSTAISYARVAFDVLVAASPHRGSGGQVGGLQQGT